MRCVINLSRIAHDYLHSRPLCGYSCRVCTAHMILELPARNITKSNPFIFFLLRNVDTILVASHESNINRHEFGDVLHDEHVAAAKQVRLGDGVCLYAAMVQHGLAIVCDC